MHATEAAGYRRTWSLAWPIILSNSSIPLVGPVFIGWMTDLPGVRASAREFLPWMIAAPLVSVWSFQLDGIFIGTTRTTEMRNGMLISAAAFWLAIQALVPALGNHGLWLALMLFLALRAITLGAWLPRIERALAVPAPVRPDRGGSPELRPSPRSGRRARPLGYG